MIKIVKSGYFDGFTSVYKPATGEALVRMQLEKFPSSLTFSAANGGMVAAPSGLTLKFPTYAFQTVSNGQIYPGEVSIYFNHREPTSDPMFSFAMPGGDFTAINSNGETVALTSYGFFNAELRGANGEELNLSPGMSAEVMFRIPESMREGAPAALPLWAFDESAGIWKYDSELTKSGIFYKGTVKHFSSWNCDYQGPACTVKASAVDCNGNPAANMSVCFVNGVCGTTDVNGNVTFPNVPANQALTLYSAQDTININPINVGETFTVTEPLLTGESMLAYIDYWQDSVVVVTFGTDPPVSYSLDGQSWQSEPLFTDVPFQDTIIVWIKDASDCPISLKALYKRERNPAFVCRAAQNQNEINQFVFSFDNLPYGTTATYYKLFGYPDIPSIMAEVFNRYVCLAEIELSNASFLASLPKEIGNLSALKYLYFVNNQLTSIPAEIGNLTSLTTLNLNQNQLTSVPPEIGNLTALTYLGLGNNQLTSVPPEIGNLTTLTYLSLSQNQLASVPPEIGNLTALTYLGLGNNQLTSVPPEIGNLTALTELEINSNQLTSLPPEIANLADTLTELYLQNNPIPVGDRPYYQSLLPNTYIQWE